SGVAGATILGDGNVAVVLDIPELLLEPGMAGRVLADDTLDAQPDLEVDQRRALVVDDSLTARRALARVLEDHGFAVQMAKDGLEALETMSDWRPDLLVIDLEMPRMNGLELASHLRAREMHRTGDFGQDRLCEVPIVMVTSRSTLKHRQQALAAGVNAYLTKPFAEDQLLDTIHELLEGETV
ncbi:MAG: response regulator, partial [Gammaproteobacteria bacterium]|nr:response regulator [Gammaproteobacteria bacterium]